MTADTIVVGPYRVPAGTLLQVGRAGGRKIAPVLRWAQWAWLAVFAGAMLYLMAHVETLVGLVLQYIAPHMAQDWVVVFVPIIIIVPAFAAYLIGRLALLQLWKRKITDYARLDSDVFVEIDDASLRIRSDFISYHLAWPGIREVFPYKRGLLISSSGLVFFVPDDALGMSEQRGQVLNAIQRRLTPEARAKTLANGLTP